jgi:flagellar basal-body rod modification protein FlgD
MSTIDTQTLERLGLTGRRQDTAKKNDELGQSDFLELMITQLTHQDPMQPMQSGEFYTQIAQFSTVAGIQELQQTFSQVANALYSSQALQASAMVGRSVLVSSPVASLASGGSISGVVDVPRDTPQVNVNIYDQAGQLVRRLGLGEQSAGRASFTWDGLNAEGNPAAPGNYFVEATMLLGGETYGLETMVETRIDSVTVDTGGQGILLNLASGGQTTITNVREIK